LEIFSCGETKALALTLFVARVIADDHDATVATNNLALVADLLDAWVNLHVSYFSSGSFLKNRFTCSDK
jgi:DeoR/GlpR family transcriptional regulator of sugar metabolism